jgi:pentose-5-phosphate-3-epimerase
MRPVDRLYKEYSEHEFKNITVNAEDEPELFEFVERIRKHGPKFSIYNSEKLEHFASRIYELRKN